LVSPFAASVVRTPLVTGYAMRDEKTTVSSSASPPLQLESGRCLVVAEVAQAHDGSLGLAHAYIDAVADAGADAVKFQTHIATAESTPHEPWRVRFSPQDETRYAYWQRMEFSEAQWRGLREHAETRSLHFLSSPFSLEAVELLARVGVAAWKIPSGELTNLALLDAVVRTRLPVLLSTGMSGLSEIDEAVNRVRGAGGQTLAVLQCTSAYPCPPEEVGLNVMTELAARYRCPGGLSDHSGTIYPSLAAATLGARLIEVHVTMSREMFGPDVGASVTTNELRALVDGVHFITRMLAAPVDKDAAAVRLEPLRRVFMKSVVARVDLPAGSLLREEHLAVRKPGTGIAPERLREVVGGLLVRSVTAGEPLRPSDVVRP
jgi:N,N'-diacetyllegionaminate synthase